MKLGQVIEYNKRNIFFLQKHSENEAGRLVPDRCVLKRLYMK